LRDSAYLTGLILIGITFLACVISFWLLVYGVFIFALGTLLVFLSKKRIKTKLLTTILPIVLYLPATYFFLLSYNYRTPKTFLIPNEYEGQIRIVYEEKCGVKLLKEKGRQMLRFPETGILILNENFDGGISNNYYLVDKSGRRTKVKEILSVSDSMKKTPYILVGGAGNLGSAGESKGITFSDFYLYNKDTILADNNKLSQKFDGTTIKTVNACRAK